MHVAITLFWYRCDSLFDLLLKMWQYSVNYSLIDVGRWLFTAMIHRHSQLSHNWWLYRNTGVAIIPYIAQGRCPFPNTAAKPSIIRLIARLEMGSVQFVSIAKCIGGEAAGAFELENVGCLLGPHVFLPITWYAWSHVFLPITWYAWSHVLSQQVHLH